MSCALFLHPRHLSRRRAKRKSLSYRTVSANAQTVTKEWILIDAENQTLGRLATRVANVLRGKHKPSFTPHVDCGDNVIIINAEKIVLTGKKMTDKVYVRHTGYPGGQRFATPQQLLNTHPIRVVEHAVRGIPTWNASEQPPKQRPCL